MLINNKPRTDNIIILKPDAKIIVTQADINNNDCPRSGWLIKNITMRSKTKNEYKYLGILINKNLILKKREESFHIL